MTEPASGRLFVALLPDDAVRAALCRARDRWVWSAGARPTRVDDLHATLVFLGAVEATRMAALMAALPVDFAPFTLRFDRSTVWENGIAALEPTGDLTALTALQAAVAGRIAAAGLPRETRRYRPHVTLAREAVGSTPPQDDDALVWPVSDYALVASRGGRYTTLATWKACRAT